jgi:hypothetical protein
LVVLQAFCLDLTQLAVALVAQSPCHAPKLHSLAPPRNMDPGFAFFEVSTEQRKGQIEVGLVELVVVEEAMEAMNKWRKGLRRRRIQWAQQHWKIGHIENSQRRIAHRLLGHKLLLLIGHNLLVAGYPP